MNVRTIILLLLLSISECYPKEIDGNYAIRIDSTDQQLESDSNTADPQEKLLEFLETNRLQGIAVAAYEGATVVVPCTSGRTFVDAQSAKKTIWYYAESINNLTLRLMEEKEAGVEDGHLTIFFVGASDAGVYQCKVGCSWGDLVVLDVLRDEDAYRVVKPISELESNPSPSSQVSKNAMVFTRWSPWSECSRCGNVGRRRRYGICHLGLGMAGEMADVDSIMSTDETTLNSKNVEKLLRAFPGGIPCRSRLLPQQIKYFLAVSGRKNEIMMGLCRVPCTSDVFEVRTPSGEIVERANNSEGVYSLCQREPPQPPLVARVITFAARGTRVVIRCPGTSLRDMPVNWRLGVEELTPRRMDRKSSGRVHLNARDHVLLNDARISDTNVYSCWQRANLAGVVKLKVYEDTRDKYGRRLLLVGSLVCVCAALALAENVHSYQRRRYRRL